MFLWLDFVNPALLLPAFVISRFLARCFVRTLMHAHALERTFCARIRTLKHSPSQNVATWIYVALTWLFFLICGMISRFL